MTKFKTRKEILESPEFKKLAFELMTEEMNIPFEEVDRIEEIAESDVDSFISRKIKQCKSLGV